MRSIRLLKIMAGEVPTPYEKAERRAARQLRRMNRIGQEELRLIDMISRREKGEDGLKPMPFARTDDGAEDKT